MDLNMEMDIELSIDMVQPPTLNSGRQPPTNAIVTFPSPFLCGFCLSYHNGTLLSINDRAVSATRAIRHQDLTANCASKPIPIVLDLLM